MCRCSLLLSVKGMKGNTCSEIATNCSFVNHYPKLSVQIQIWFHFLGWLAVWFLEIMFTSDWLLLPPSCFSCGSGNDLRDRIRIRKATPNKKAVKLYICVLILAHRTFVQLVPQGVTKRFRRSWLTSSALVYEPKWGGEGGGSCGVSANEYSCTHGAQINFGDLIPYLTYVLPSCCEIVLFTFFVVLN
jgi:hypothetical protein